MSKQPVQTAILAASAIGAALLSIVALSFTAPTGEMSKLLYDGNYYCVSNWIEEETADGKRVYLPSPDGRGKKDPRLVGKEDWLRMDQVEADTKEEAEQKATQKGLFEPSEKVALRKALDDDNKAFFTSHFNTGATHPGPCVGSGFGTGIVGKWINDAIREDCFGIKPSGDRQVVDNPNAFSANQIDEYIAKHSPRSPLKGMGSAFVAASQKYGINPGVLLGITNAESSLGVQCETSKTPAPKGLGGSKNAFGLTDGGQGHFLTFSSYKEGIDRAAANLASSKYKNLQSLREIRLKWCGYETESESSGIKLSDGSVITYACQNKSSSWEQEVMAVVNGLIAANPATQAPAQTSNYTIVVDPGHGTSANTRKNEDAIQLQISLKLKGELENRGYKVVMTRSSTGGTIGGATNEDTDNVARASIANSANADIAIRLHSDDRSDNSFWVVYPDRTGKDRTGYSGPMSSAVIPESKKFAGILTSALKQAGFSGITKGEGAYSSSSKGDLLIFSAHSKVPVVTLELYGNENDSLQKKYSSATTQQKVAQTIVKAVESYLGSGKTTTVSANAESSAASNPAKKNPNCPPQAPPAGPQNGQDYRSQIAQAFEKALRDAYADEAASEELGDENYENNEDLGAVDNEIAKVALAEVGYQGSPGGGKGKRDCTKYDGCAQWCAYFVTWSLKQAGKNIPSIGSSRSVLAWYKNNGHATFTDPAKAGEGDIVVWKRGEKTGHIGIVVANDGNRLRIVEGNTSDDRVKAYWYSYSSVRSNLNGLLGLGRW